MDSLLHRCMQVTLILAALLVSGRTVSLWVQEHRATEVVPAAPPAAPRDLAASLKGASVSELEPPGRGGVILFVSPTCGFCEQSVPFYQRLARALAARNLSILVAVADNRERAGGEAYVRDRKLEGARSISPAVLRGLGISRTPTLLTYDDTAHIVGTWVGKLPPEHESLVESSLQALARKHAAYTAPEAQGDRQ